MLSFLSLPGAAEWLVILTILAVPAVIALVVVLTVVLVTRRKDDHRNT